MKSLTNRMWMMGLCMMFLGLCLLSEVQAAPTVKIGDYIRFGKYYNAPVLWRVIHKDSNGDVLLLADRILTLKAFDAKGAVHKNQERRAKGSNNWFQSNIRQWLNSTSANSGSARIDWLQNDPTRANMLNGSNAYASERGFLADGNFSAAERNLIKSVTNKVLLAKTDVARKEGGTEVHMFDNQLATVVTNDERAYFKRATDRVFLLSAQQLKVFVYDRRAVLGKNYHIAKPTSVAVNTSTYKNPVFLNTNLPWYYWLNTPSASTAEDVRFVFSSGGIGSNPASLDNSGIRPALYLNMKLTRFAQGGKGTGSQPYVVAAANPSATDKQPPSVPTNLQISEMNGNSLSIRWTASRDNVGVRGYEMFMNDTFIANVTTTGYRFRNLGTSRPVRVKIRAVDRAGNKSAFTGALNSVQTIQLIGNSLFVNFKRVELGTRGVPIRRGGETLVPGRLLLQALGMKVQWNRTRRTMTATGPGTGIAFTVGMNTVTVNNRTKRSLPVAPAQINGNVMIPLSWVASQLRYKLNVK